MEGGEQQRISCRIYHHQDAKNRTVLFELTFDRWWLTFLAKDLNKVLREEISEIDRIKSLMRFDD